MDKILYERQNRVSYVYMNRPEQYNAMNRDMLLEMLDVLTEVERNDDRVVVLSGRGKAFSAGGDIGMMVDFSDKGFFDDVMQTIEAIALKLYMMPKIVISAVQGAAAGLGLSLALSADFIVAHEEAKLGMLFIGIGLAPDGGGHFLLRDRLGTQRAKQFIWGREQVKGSEAQTMGLVDLLTETDALEEAGDMAYRILASPMEAMLKTKMMYHQYNLETLKQYLKAEKEAQWELRQTNDHREGVQAFKEKRDPVFTGK
ncbi:putative enoyl-CoA hydratase/isomerase YhaR [Lentibacillus kapialis]|uniref:Enoyl-CoA hydratase/isomerase YhaR n=1 Tax=Lentibacillus kapialis TaxID=340214 RepID=A0A917PUE2_9BACI|nr:enoyl-CoA hydratase [Lentibacillus kapialis]GGJ92350.1 putative enoyl-CoA hydratase/isomerase YhaR [Lentibacillus kapialis]